MVRAKIITYLDSDQDQEAELRIMNGDHNQSCQYKENFGEEESVDVACEMFEDEKFLTLLNAGVKPKDIINQYNKETGKEVENEKKIRIKISQLRHEKKKNISQNLSQSQSKILNISKLSSDNTLLAPKGSRV